jgi:hypothetical protein
MATLTRTRKQRKAPQPVHGVARWIGSTPTQAHLDTGDAILQVTVSEKEPAFYHAEAIRDAGKLRGFRLIKVAALDKTATYDLELTPHGLRCDCPDATFCDRPGGCKHAVGLAAALKAANLS